MSSEGPPDPPDPLISKEEAAEQFCPPSAVKVALAKAHYYSKLFDQPLHIKPLCRDTPSRLAAYNAKAEFLERVADAQDKNYSSLPSPLPWRQSKGKAEPKSCKDNWKAVLAAANKLKRKVASRNGAKPKLKASPGLKPDRRL